MQPIQVGSGLVPTGSRGSKILFWLANRKQSIVRRERGVMGRGVCFSLRVPVRGVAALTDLWKLNLRGQAEWEPVRYHRTVVSHTHHTCMLTQGEQLTKIGPLKSSEVFTHGEVQLYHLQ